VRGLPGLSLALLACVGCATARVEKVSAEEGSRAASSAAPAARLSAARVDFLVRSVTSRQAAPAGSLMPGEQQENWLRLLAALDGAAGEGGPEVEVERELASAAARLELELDEARYGHLPPWIGERLLGAPDGRFAEQRVGERPGEGARGKARSRGAKAGQGRAQPVRGHKGWAKEQAAAAATAPSASQGEVETEGLTEAEEAHGAERLAFSWPVAPVNVTSKFGGRFHPVKRRYKKHHGIDLEARKGQEVHSAASGVVLSAGRFGSHGLQVEIDHGEGVVTRYSHLSALLVRRGERVEAGDRVGRAGRTGVATGVHLHFEVWRDGVPVNPLGESFRELHEVLAAKAFPAS
jgi:hypothetical protein